MIVKDARGNEFLEFMPIHEEDAVQVCKPLTHSLAVVHLRDDFLLGWNQYRRQWEIFGGCMEKDETPRECVMRECCEEIGVESSDFAYLGMMKIKMMPDYYSPKERIEYGGLFCVSLDLTIQNIENRRKDKKEIGRIDFYRNVKGKERIAEIDEKLLDYWQP